MNSRDFERGVRLAGLPVPDSDIKLIGSDPVYYSPFHLGEGAAIAHALIGSKIDQMWREQGHKAQQITVDVRHAAASLNSYRWLEIKNKSGIASKRGLLVGACVVDRGYTGEIFVNLHNVTHRNQTIHSGDKIAQGVFVKITTDINLVESENIYDAQTSRGEGALGSTGTK